MRIKLLMGPIRTRLGTSYLMHPSVQQLVCLARNSTAFVTSVRDSAILIIKAKAVGWQLLTS